LEGFFWLTFSREIIECLYGEGGSMIPSRVIVALLAIDGERRLLLVRSAEKDCWTPPGGKVERGETLKQALMRELAEELPGLEVTIGKSYKCFRGTTPHSGRLVEVHTFFGEVSGSIKYGAEVTGSQWVSRRKLWGLALSQITADIIESLIRDGHL